MRSPSDQVKLIGAIALCDRVFISERSKTRRIVECAINSVLVDRDLFSA